MAASEEARWTFILLFLVLIILTCLRPLAHLEEVQQLLPTQLFAQLSLTALWVQELLLPG
jgi:hypothetical protein